MSVSENHGMYMERSMEIQTLVLEHMTQLFLQMVPTDPQAQTAVLLGG